MSRAESDGCEDQRRTKRLKTSHSAKDASTGMRQSREGVQIENRLNRESSKSVAKLHKREQDAENS